MSNRYRPSHSDCHHSDCHKDDRSSGQDDDEVEDLTGFRPLQHSKVFGQNSMDGNKNANNNPNNIVDTDQVFPNSDNDNKILPIRLKSLSNE